MKDLLLEGDTQFVLRSGCRMLLLGSDAHCMDLRDA